MQPFMFRRGDRMTHPFETLNIVESWDFRGEPTNACVCGCIDMLIVVRFDPDTGMPAWWMREGMCAKCRCLLTVPIPTEDANV